MILDITRDTFWNYFWRRIYFKENKLIDLIQKKITIGEFISAPKLKGNLFCYKEPFLCFAAKEFSDYYGKSKFIHIIRNGLDNADSMERSYGDALSDEVLSSEFLSTNKNSEIGMFDRIDGFNYPYWLDTSDYDKFKNSDKYVRYIFIERDGYKRTRIKKFVTK